MNRLWEFIDCIKLLLKSAYGTNLDYQGVDGRSRFRNFTIQISALKKVTFLLVFLFSGLFLKIQAQTPGYTVPADPFAGVIAFTNDDYDLGKVTAGKPASYVVEIKNISKKPLTFINAYPRCSCTKADFTPNQKIAPGQTIKVTVHFDGSVTGQFTRFTDLNFAGDLSKLTRYYGEGLTDTTGNTSNKKN
jgi:hypothetical protein